MKRREKDYLNQDQKRKDVEAVGKADRLLRIRKPWVSYRIKNV